VIPARLFGRSERRHLIEALLLLEVDAGYWEALVKPSRQVRVGDRLILADDTITAEVIEKRGEGRHLLKLVHDGNLTDLLWRFGRMPVPPYIKRQGAKSPHPPFTKGGYGGIWNVELDRERYQTVYAKHEGAIAAPTAGFHFTPELIETLTRRGVAVAPITLYVGPGTFRPVRVEEVAVHRMEPEHYIVPEQTALAIKTAKREGQRVIAVGTTTIRTLEHAAVNGDVRSGAGVTDLFIYPGYHYKCVDALITNFHLPRSTLLMLVSAFVGRQAIMRTYHEAIALRYRFYSYGDAMLIV
jgi:S-adenosylmethionine:tRNA ribosyltransferase-isomerase